MRTLSRILVVVDSRKSSSVTLQRARLLAKATGATITALATNPWPDTTSQTNLETMITPLQHEGLDVHSLEQWQGSVNHTILHVQQMERCNLLIKEPKQESPLRTLLRRPHDWSLLRQCRVPVLLVRHSRSWLNGNILAAIDAAPRDGEHQMLNHVVLDYAASIAGFSDSQLYVGTAYSESVLTGQDTRHNYHNNCMEITQGYDLKPEHIHIEKGPAAVMIPDLVKTCDISLVVLGTVANNSWKSVFRGNTAEQIINLINTDILVLRPNDMMDPLEQQLQFHVS